MNDYAIEFGKKSLARFARLSTSQFCAVSDEVVVLMLAGTKFPDGYGTALIGEAIRRLEKGEIQS